MGRLIIVSIKIVMSMRMSVRATISFESERKSKRIEGRGGRREGKEDRLECVVKYPLPFRTRVVVPRR